MGLSNIVLGGNCWGSSITALAGLNCSAVNLVIMIPTPSIHASNKPPTMPDTNIAPFPLLTERITPVRAPLVIEFQGSSFLRRYTMVQSIAENNPPHTPKLPPVMGAFVFIDCKEP